MYQKNIQQLISKLHNEYPVLEPLYAEYQNFLFLMNDVSLNAPIHSHEGQVYNLLYPYDDHQYQILFDIPQVADLFHKNPSLFQEIRYDIENDNVLFQYDSILSANRDFEAILSVPFPDLYDSRYPIKELIIDGNHRISYLIENEVPEIYTHLLTLHEDTDVFYDLSSYLIYHLLHDTCTYKQYHLDHKEKEWSCFLSDRITSLQRAIHRI